MAAHSLSVFPQKDAVIGAEYVFQNVGGMSGIRSAVAVPEGLVMIVSPTVLSNPFVPVAKTLLSKEMVPPLKVERLPRNLAGATTPKLGSAAKSSIRRKPPGLPPLLAYERMPPALAVHPSASVSKVLVRTDGRQRSSRTSRRGFDETALWRVVLRADFVRRNKANI